MKIAFRRTPPSDANYIEKLASSAIRYKLATVWPHVGFVIDDVLYHAGGRHGLQKTELSEAKWDLIDIGDELDERAIKIFDELVALGAGYDWIELLDFSPIQPFIKIARKSKTVKKWLDNNVYCYQLVLWVLTGSLPAVKATPELIMFEIIKILQKKLAEATIEKSTDEEVSVDLDIQFKRNNNDGS